MQGLVRPIQLLRRFTCALQAWARSARAPRARRPDAPLPSCVLDNAWLRKITDGLSPEVLIGIVSVDGTLTHINRASQDALGHAESAVLGQQIAALPWWSGASGDDLGHGLERVQASVQRGLRGETSRYDIAVRTHGGAALVLDLLWMPLFDARGAVQALFLSGRDITERVRAQARNTYLAGHDALTGLPNRQSFLAQVEARLQGAAAPVAPSPFSILVLGLDRTNWVNEALGPAAGDALLKTLAGRLHRAFPGGATVAARLGGDVFALLLPQALHAAQLQARAIQQLLDAPMTLTGRPLHMSACIGVTEVDAAQAEAANAQALLQQAETALCQAKSLGAGSVTAFTAPPPSTDLPRLFLLSDLHEAVPRQQLVLHYQPQWDASTRRVIGAEALVRWKHPEHGLIAPDRFIPIAEDSALIVAIGDWVLRQACADAAGWRTRGQAPLHVCVNVSPRQLRDPDFPARVRQVLVETGLPAQALVLEVTESALMADVAQASALLSTLREAGVMIALDDFGTGYSSLGQLRRLPIDLLKIDRSLVPDVAAGTEAVSITRAIITMAASLRLQVLAEGVENDHQLELLRASGCHWMQGYHIARPLPLADFLQFLKNHATDDCARRVIAEPVNVHAHVQINTSLTDVLPTCPSAA
jgi:diguanylate cyclase (GGDEF)-like protein/PAS domain S-box-containing protein